MDENCAIGLIRIELYNAQNKFPPFRSPHEGLAIIEEEFLEFRHEVFNGSMALCRKEVIQLGAMSLRYLIDCSDYNPDPLRPV